MLDNELIELQGFPCGICGKAQLYTDADGMCEDCRKNKYDHQECSCGKKFTGQSGWYVPSFRTYSNCLYYCPECIEKRRKFVESPKFIKRFPNSGGHGWIPTANSENI